jgi:hypothetical protein
MRNKCAECGLVNKLDDEACRRCGTLLNQQSESLPAEEKVKKRRLAQRIGWILGMTAVVLLICYLSLLLTSDGLGYDQRKTVERAVAVLEANGFAKQAFVLRRLVSYRATDNWWNFQVGHHDAYAATNFPFEVVTLYPDFFEVAVDDNERAAILLHECYHLFGYGEVTALDQTWRAKRQLGWTEDRYRQTLVWANTEELTRTQLPSLFRCGSEGKSDCTP